MKVWVVFRYNDIIAICDSEDKIYDIVWNDFKSDIDDGLFTCSEAESILKDLKEKGDSWLYHIEQWNVV